VFGGATCAGSSRAFLAYPRLELNANTKITFDSRLARPFAVDVGDPRVTINTTAWEYVDYPASHANGVFAFGSISAGQIGPDAPPGELVGMVIGTLSDDPIGGSPSVVYNLAHSERGHLPTGWSATLAPDQLASVDARHAGQDDAVYTKASLPVLVDPVQGLVFVGFTLDDLYDGPFERTEHFFGPGFLWADSFSDNRLFGDESEELVFREHGPGERLTESWNQAAFAPAFSMLLASAGGVSSLRSSASRIGDQLLVSPSLVADTGSPARITFTFTPGREHISLFRDGALIAERFEGNGSPFVRSPFVVPPEPATYRYEHDMVRPDSFELSQHVTVAWTFRSEHVPGDRPVSLSLPTLRFSPALDQHNQASGRLTIVPLSFDRPPGAATPPIADVNLEVSFDDGGHWSRAPVIEFGGQRIAVVLNRAGARFVSLRGNATDAQGNRIDQTIIHAYGLAP
jgi:hypothetical protein